MDKCCRSYKGLQKRSHVHFLYWGEIIEYLFSTVLSFPVVGLTFRLVCITHANLKIIYRAARKISYIFSTIDDICRNSVLKCVTHYLNCLFGRFPEIALKSID